MFFKCIAKRVSLFGENNEYRRKRRKQLNFDYFKITCCGLRPSQTSQSLYTLVLQGPVIQIWTHSIKKFWCLAREEWNLRQSLNFKIYTVFSPAHPGSFSFGSKVKFPPSVQEQRRRDRVHHQVKGCTEGHLFYPWKCRNVCPKDRHIKGIHHRSCPLYLTFCLFSVVCAVFACICCFRHLDLPCKTTLLNVSIFLWADMWQMCVMFQHKVKSQVPLWYIPTPCRPLPARNFPPPSEGGGN